MSTSNPGNYLLPCSESYTCLDRFSICSEDVEEDEYGRIRFWPLFKTLLKAQIQHHAQLIEVLESIAVVLRDTPGPAGDYGLLKRFLETRPRFFDDIWPKLAVLALELPDLFPGDSLPVLQSSETDRVVLSRRQAACLVVHQFLCTLAPPAWKDDNIYQFDVWYNSQQRQGTAPLAYLEALFLYFEQGGGNLDIWSNSTESWSVSYSLRSSPVSSVEEDTPGLSLPLTTLKVTNVDHYDKVPAALGVPGGATVISANKYIGFGQSATQEEIHVGISPEACPAVLITPPLQTHEALVVKGAQAMVNLIGQRRDIRSEAMPQPEGGMQAWRERTMLFIDALEIDMISDEHGLPDLFPSHVDREINKAALAFQSGRYDAVRTGIWGCGAFGGDPGVKMLAMWCAASLAGTNLDLYVDGWQRESAGELEVFVQKAEGKLKTVGDLRSLLLSAPKDLKRLETLKWFSQALD